jgi:hypothetical protein
MTQSGHQRDSNDLRNIRLWNGVSNLIAPASSGGMRGGQAVTPFNADCRAFELLQSLIRGYSCKST